MFYTKLLQNLSCQRFMLLYFHVKDGPLWYWCNPPLLSNHKFVSSFVAWSCFYGVVVLPTRCVKLLIDVCSSSFSTRKCGNIERIEYLLRMCNVWLFPVVDVIFLPGQCTEASWKVTFENAAVLKHRMTWNRNNLIFLFDISALVAVHYRSYIHHG